MNQNPHGKSAPDDDPLAFLAGGGEMGTRTRDLDWSQTPVGPVADWPQSLKTAVSICLGSRYPIVLWWGKQALTQFYNDGYIPMLGVTKHPAWLGRSARGCWNEIWHIVGPMVEGVFATGEATWSEDLLLVLDRNVRHEEAYFTFSYSPIRDDSGSVGGIFCAVTETTGRVIGERRLRTLRDLGSRVAEAKEAGAACRVAVRTLAGNPADLPFALIYLLDDDGRQARLVAATGLETGSAPAPDRIDLSEAPGLAVWPLRQVFDSGTGELVSDVTVRFGQLPRGPWLESPEAAVVLPIAAPGQARPTGFLVAGLSPRRVVDGDYRSFIDLIAGHVATAIANARVYEAEKLRADALAELDRSKTAFFSNVSHEFRTPLTLMLGPVEELLAAPSERLLPENRELLAVVHRNGLRLQRLVNVLLDFSRIEAGRVRALYQSTDLAGLTADLASNFRSACDRAGLQLKVDCPTLAEPVFVDRQMWEKIVLNLLSNAFKFTFEGEIAVSLRLSEKAAELRLQDTGTGIPAEEIPRLFERFHRIENATGRTHEGSGIGLALVQELVKLHGGSITVESQVGRGTIFSISIPRGSAHLPREQVGANPTAAAISPGANPFVEEALRWLPDAANDQTATPGFSSDAEILTLRPPIEGDRPRVLVADDNADMRQYIARLLAGEYLVEAVADGAAALAAARRLTPDLILSDVMMPRLDGFGLLRELRADPVTAVVPMILLSARAGEESRIEGMQAAADDYLVKPFSANELLARVGALLQINRLRRETDRERRLFATALSNSADFIYTFDLDGRFTYVNQALLALWKKDLPEAVGKNFFDLGYPAELADRLQRQIAEVIETRRPLRDETSYTSGQGELQYEYIFVPVFGLDGSVESVAGSTRDITERKEVEAALRQSEERLRAADRRKDEFLATLAHELRNPLAPIRNGLEIMRLANGDPESIDQARMMMGRQLGQMVHLVDDLLDLSRISRGKIELRKERIDLAKIVQHAVETSRPVFEQAKHDLTIDLPPFPIYVDADVTRLAQVFSNLLNNAAKYTEPGGRVRLSVQRQGGDVVVSVRDNGIGIPPHMLPHVFEMFTQVDRNLERSQGGLGIGLSIVKQLVQMHGGVVEARSDGHGMGSEFVARLPVVLSVVQTQCEEAEPIQSSGRRRILVVDDNRDAALSLAMMLKLMGNETRTAHDGFEAFDLGAAFRPDLILLDIGMPRLNGYDTARQIREQPWGKGVVLVALTGWGQEEDRRRSKAAGFDHHMVKPIEPAALDKLLSGLNSATA